MRAEPVDHRLHALIEVRADPVHLVDVGDPRHVVLVGLAPDGLGLGLDAGDGVEQRDRAVEHAQRALDLDREVDVAGRVDDVDPMAVPLGRRGRGGDRDAALLLLLHPVHRRGALVHLAHLVRAAGVVEDPLGRRRLARVDVGHDPDVAGLLEGELARHGKESLSVCWRTARLGAKKTGPAGPVTITWRRPEGLGYVSSVSMRFGPRRERAHRHACAPRRCLMVAVHRRGTTRVPRRAAAPPDRPAGAAR